MKTRYQLFLKLFPITVFLFYNNFSAQEIIKTIQLSNGQEITEIHSNSKYISLIIYDNDEYKSIHYLLNKNGEPIDINIENSKYYMKKLTTIAESNILITIQKPNNSENESRNLDIISSYDIISGNKNWEANSLASNYELSPDNNYLLTTTPSTETRSKIDILSIKDGAKLVVPKNIGFYNQATWLDSDRIAIIKRISESNYNRNTENKIINEINNNIKNLRIKAKEGLITKEEYKKNLKNLKTKKEKTYKSLNKKRGRNNKQIVTVEASLFIIYNFKTDQIEVEKSLYDSEGFPFSIFADVNEFNFLSTDENGNIYINGFILSNNNSTITSIIKLDPNGDLLWSSKIGTTDEYFIGKKILIENNLNILVKLRGNELVKLDLTNGEWINRNMIDSRIVKLFNENKKQSDDKIRLFKNIEVIEEDGIVNIYKENK